MILGIIGTGVWIYKSGYDNGYEKAVAKHAAEEIDSKNKAIKKMEELADLSNNVLKQIDEKSKKDDSRLDAILLNSKKKGPVTTVPCKPNDNFVDTWNELKGSK